jgi:hypothetical protein
VSFYADLDRFLRQHGVRHFTAAELCPLGQRANGAGPPLQAPPPYLWAHIVPTLVVLEEIRADIGRPIPVTSGYRDAIYNAAVSGSKASLHIWFNACDISRTVAAAVVERARAHTLAPYMGIGTYANGSAHIDTRGLFGRESPARW